MLIAGGGTGGHIIPALAIADELVKSCDASIRFVGTARGLESKLVPAAGYALNLIEVGPLKNVSPLTRLRTVADLPLALWHCHRLIRSFAPHVVVGVGGYASGPAMAAALLLRVPTLAFEPNAAPGLANRLIGKRVTAAAVNFAPAARYFRNVEVSGIPVRAQFFSLAARPPGAPPQLLVFGGSQGARALNSAMPAIAVRLLEAVPGLTILHQAGARHAEVTEAAYLATGADPERWRVHPFLDDMARCFEAADLVLARSGASTVAELSAAGKPALLVPFPLAADDHQRRNAEVMEAAGAAEVLLQKDLTPETLLGLLTGLLGNAGRLAAMGAKARLLARPDAAERIASMARRIAQR